jgi:hypothetical protein
MELGSVAVATSAFGESTHKYFKVNYRFTNKHHESVIPQVRDRTTSMGVMHQHNPVQLCSACNLKVQGKSFSLLSFFHFHYLSIYLMNSDYQGLRRCPLPGTATFRLLRPESVFSSVQMLTMQMLGHERLGEILQNDGSADPVSATPQPGVRCAFDGCMNSDSMHITVLLGFDGHKLAAEGCQEVAVSQICRHMLSNAVQCSADVLLNCRRSGPCWRAPT